MQLAFLNPKYLWLLLSIPLLILIHFFSLRFLRTRAWIFANFEAIKRVSGDKESLRNSRVITKNIWLLLIQVFIVCVLVFAASDPVFIYEGLSSQESFVIAIDASSSMLANDFEPNRLEAAKLAANSFVDGLGAKARIGIVSFAGTSFVELGMTDNVDDIKAAIGKIEIKRIGGTDIGSAMITSGNIMSQEDHSKTIIIMTDGRSTVGTPVEEGVNYAIENGIVVHSIGMGTEAGGTFIRGDIVSKIDEDTLVKIAENTGGKYFNAEDIQALGSAFTSIVTTAQDKIIIKLQLPFMLVSLALIFLEWALINTRYRTLP